MKKILLFILLLGLLLAVGCVAQDIYYQDGGTVAWDVPLVAPDGAGLLSGDSIRYEVYGWDQGLGDITLQPIESLTVLSTWIDVDPLTNLNDGGEDYEQVNITFPDRKEWAIALRATHIDGGANETVYDGILYSTVGEDTKSGVPFLYTPLSGVPSPGLGPENLREAGM